MLNSKELRYFSFAHKSNQLPTTIYLNYDNPGLKLKSLTFKLKFLIFKLKYATSTYC